MLHFVFYRTMLLKDLDFEVAFKYIDEATVADWKGKDLKQAKHIPNIDILLLAVRKVRMLFSRVSFSTNSPLLNDNE